MAIPLKKPQPVVKDVRTNLRLVAHPPTGPRIAAFARLPAKPPRREFSFAAGLALCFFLATIIMIGLTGGTVMWFAYDTATAAAAPVLPKPQLAKITVKVATPAPQVSLAAPPAILQVAQLLEPQAGQVPLPISKDMIVPVSTLAPEKHEQMALPVAPVFAPPPAPVAAEALVAATNPQDIQLVVHDAPSVPAKGDAANAAANVATARILVQQSRLMEAITQMEKAVRAAPGNVSYRFNLAILYDRAGQDHDALMLYRQVLKAAEYGETPDSASLIEEAALDEKTGRISPQALNTIRMRVDYLEGLERE